MAPCSAQGLFRAMPIQVKDPRPENRGGHNKLDRRRVDKTADPVYKDYGECEIANARQLLWDLAQRPNKYGQIQIAAVKALFGEIVAKGTEEGEDPGFDIKEVEDSNVPDL